MNTPRTLASGLLLLPAIWLHTAVGQSTGSSGALSNSINTPRPFDPGQNTTNPSALAEQVQNPYLGSVPVGPVVPGDMPLSLKEAVDHALRANLGLIDTGSEHTQARALRVRALSALLPQLSADSVQDYRNLVLDTIGTARAANSHVLEPFNFEGAHVNLQDRLLDLSAVHSIRAANANLEASQAGLADARNIVVLAATSSYLLVSASQVRLNTAKAQLETAAATEGLIHDRVVHEVSPQIEAIRAQVLRRTAEQRVAVATATLEKDKLALTRIIGLPIAQVFHLTDDLMYHPAPERSEQELISAGENNRQDLQAARARVQAASETVKEKSSQRLPTVELRASAGESGINFARSIPDYEVAGRVSVPLFTGRRIESDILSARAVLNRRQAELSDLLARVTFDVRSASLDLKAAETSVQVSADNIALAKEGVRQARDRYENGVTNSVELVQAQQAMAEAQDNRVSSIYAHSLAKLMLIRATGSAEADYLNYLGVH